MLKCPKCLLLKASKSFVNHRWCGECKRQARKASYERNRQREIDRARVYNAAHPAEKAASDKRNYLANKTKRLFTAQKTAAKRRGIEFKLTFLQWLAFWGEKYAMRGRSPEALCMARHGDIGPYELGNISIVTNRENLAQRKF